MPSAPSWWVCSLPDKHSIYPAWYALNKNLHENKTPPAKEGFLLHDSLKSVRVVVADRLLQIIRLADLGDQILLRFQPVDVFLDIIQQFLLKRSLGEFFLVLRTAGLYDYVDEAEVESVAAKLSQYGLELSDACRASYLAMKGAVGMYTLPVFGAEQGGLLEGDQQNNVLVGGSGADVLKGGHGEK